jgi:hypothetical protein
MRKSWPKLLRQDGLSAVSPGENGLRTLKELSRTR